MVAGRCEARVRVGPYRHAPDLRDQPLGGEAAALTSVEDGITSFAWRLTAGASPTREGAEARRDERPRKKYGEFEGRRPGPPMTHLFVVDVGTRATRTLTSGPFTVGSFDCRPTASASRSTIASIPPLRAEAPRTFRSSRSRYVGAQAGLPEGPTRSRSVARRYPHRLRDVDGEPRVLLLERVDCDRCRDGGAPAS